MTSNELGEISRVRSLCRSGAARKVRQAAGLSIGEVASAAEVSVAAISRWELCLRSPHGEPGLRYARILDSLLSGRPS